jgi:prepilin-type processing-associated H-X9-DG protein
LEATDVYAAMNFGGVPWGHDTMLSSLNRTALSTRIAVFLCPSDWDGIDEQYDLAHNNYRACAGTLPYNLPTDTPPPIKGNNGVFWYQSSTRPGQIRDGAGTTALFSERCLGSSSSPDTKADYFLSGSDEEACRRATASTVARFTSPVEWSGQRWADGNVFYTRYQHGLTPNRQSCMFGQEDDDAPVLVSATSRHPGGVNCLTVDGGVRFMTDGISEPIWRALGTIRGGEVVNDSDFSP